MRGKLAQESCNDRYVTRDLSSTPFVVGDRGGLNTKDCRQRLHWHTSFLKGPLEDIILHGAEESTRKHMNLCISQRLIRAKAHIFM
jgi:hypothetical protein